MENIEEMKRYDGVEEIENEFWMWESSKIIQNFPFRFLRKDPFWERPINDIGRVNRVDETKHFEPFHCRIRFPLNFFL